MRCPRTAQETHLESTKRNLKLAQSYLQKAMSVVEREGALGEIDKYIAVAATEAFKAPLRYSRHKKEGLKWVAGA